ncbi:Maf-like protein [Macleaya cordata]|uniref:Maf-like protein n=1 Tax=Macleaya cordata TaxID=56857 RepID=A0A200R7M4_MACCD|nr:Maf-like protein [Macleaya cordata]
MAESENGSSSSFKIILGSSSSSRRQILTEMGYEFTILTADIDEKDIRKEKPEELVMALAEAKADAIISRLQLSNFQEKDAEPTLLITADTVVVYEGVIREKPSNKDEARRFIKGLFNMFLPYLLPELAGSLVNSTCFAGYSGGHASTVGSVLVTNLKTGIRKGGYDRVEVYFHDIPDEIIDNLIDEGIVLNVAGGLMLEHPLTLPFVEAVIDGTVQMGAADSVMGLPKALTEKLIQESLL